MLRVVRFGIRIRKFNFVEESYKLAGTKDEIALPEDLRNLKKYLETGEKDSSHLLKEIEKINNPYKELGISQSASNDQIQKTINRRKNQLNHEIQKNELLKLETGEKDLSGETSGIIRIDNQV
jgi:DNA anti-recombination protein RmuC